MRIRTRSAAALVLAVVLGSCSDNGTLEPTSAPVPRGPSFDVTATAGPDVRISEIHYDNAGTDAGEKIEISAPAGTDLTGWSVVLYNGSGGAPYNAAPYGPAAPLTGSSVTTTVCTSGTRKVVVLSYAVNGIQNGSPDGVALVNASGAVVEFLSYEGTFAAVGGPANGMTSTDIGASEAGNAAEQPGLSLQRTGADPTKWTGPLAHTFESCNDDAPDEPPPPPPPPAAPEIRVSEIHYDNTGEDAGEAIEIEGPAGADITGWTIVLYNGSTGAPYGVVQTLKGTLPATCDARGVVFVSYLPNGIQNGGPDGLALVDASGKVVEFLSYEGAFEAVGGPAHGIRSTDIGLAESSSTPIGQSLQRNADGSWPTPPAGASHWKPWTLGTCNSATSPPPVITFSGRDAADVAIPVGFEDQLFATERASNGPTAASFTWSSETPAIATVDEDGVVRVLAAGTAVIRATTKTDGTTGTTATVALLTQVPVASTLPYGRNAEFGEPADQDPSDDYIVRYPQFTSSYSSAKGTPNWVSYNLNATHFGPEDRCDCFTFDDQSLPGFQRYTTADYTGAGDYHGYRIDRGHLVRSADRTSASLDNARTFYFTNIIPQAADNNQGPWADLELHLGNLARNQGKEIYIIAGVAGGDKTVKDEGKILIPAKVWKVAVIMAAGQGLANVDGAEDVEVIAVVMPNVEGIAAEDWRTYETTVDAVERESGYDVLALLDDQIEIAVESETKPPVAVTDGPYNAIEREPITMSGAGSSDPDGDALTYRWAFGDNTTGSGVSISHAYRRAGVYDVSLTVTDVRGLLATAATKVTVITPAEALGQALAMVQALVDAGKLDPRAAPALRAAIDAARRQLDRGRLPTANHVRAAIRLLDAFVAAGKLTAADTEALRALLSRVVVSLSS